MIAEGCVGMSIHAGCCIIAENQYITVQRTGMYQLVDLQGQIDSFPWRDAVEEIGQVEQDQFRHDGMGCPESRLDGGKPRKEQCLSRPVTVCLEETFCKFSHFLHRIDAEVCKVGVR